MTERPRDVYLAACSQIARGFEPLGFRYLRSKRKIARRIGDFVCEVQFQSSARNYLVPTQNRDAAAEQLLNYGDRHQIRFTEDHINDMLQGSIHLQMAASVHSKRLQQWRALQRSPLRKDDFVADRRFGRFNLAPMLTREQSIVEAASLTHEITLPFFDLFRTPHKLVTQLMEGEVPGFWEAPGFDFVLCFGGRDLGREMLDRLLTSDPGLRARFSELLPRFQTEEWRGLAAMRVDQGVPQGGHAERAGRLAQIAAAYDLE